jgi:hypothetical protein
MLRSFRKPLVVVAPKILLRLSAAASTLDEMGSGTHFQPVLGQNPVDPRSVERIVFVSGKHFYAVSKFAEEKGIKDVAFVRLEQLCPFPTKELQDEVSKYPNAKRKTLTIRRLICFLKSNNISQPKQMFKMASLIPSMFSKLLTNNKNILNETFLAKVSEI